VEIDWEAESRNFNANAAEIKTSPVDAINNAVKDYWGLIVFGGLVLTAGIFIGRRGL
jgi:hypothetical protein